MERKNKTAIQSLTRECKINDLVLINESIEIVNSRIYLVKKRKKKIKGKFYIPAFI